MQKRTPSAHMRAVERATRIIREVEHQLGAPVDELPRETLSQSLRDTLALRFTETERKRANDALRYFYAQERRHDAASAPQIPAPPGQVTDGSEATKSQYTERAEQLIARFERETEARFDPAQPAFATWIARITEPLGRATRRQYRAALNHYYREVLGTAIEPPAIDASQSGEPGDRAPRRKGVRALPTRDLARLNTWLAERDDPFASLARNTLNAGLCCGLRPREWCEASLETITDEPLTQDNVFSVKRTQVLRVRNAKNTHGRAHSATRTLIIEVGAEPAEWAVIFNQPVPHLIDTTCEGWAEALRLYTEHHTATAEADARPEVIRERAINQLRKVVASWVHRATQALRLPPYTLYSARHQFAANAKAAGLSKIEIAALMGHASPETAGTHYGRRRSGRRGSGGLLVAPSAADVAAVEKSMNGASAGLTKTDSLYPDF